MARVSVVGHVEWVDFLEVDGFPGPGELVHAQRAFARAAGGGGVAAVVMAELGAEVDFFCALGHDALGETAAAQLRERGVTVIPAWRDQPTRRAFTLLQPGGERTIVTIGERLEPLGADALDWDRLNSADGVYFTAGDSGALAHARQARTLVASPRARSALAADGPCVDALVFSAGDRDESEWARQAARRTRLSVATEGASGGAWSEQSGAGGRWVAQPPPGAPHDAFGCGDSFAAAFTFGLASEMSVAEAADLGAQVGARCLARAGAP
jgi:ribokinase